MKLTALLLCMLFIAGSARANQLELPTEQLEEIDKLTLAQAMVGEADWHEPDHIAIAFVLARRWVLYRERMKNLRFRDYIRMYSSPMRRDLGARTTWLRSLPWGPIEGPHRERWDRVRALVERWLDGQIKDPCPGAMHWGGTMDRPGPGMKPVSCGQTRNTFYTYRRPSTPPAAVEARRSAPRQNVDVPASAPGDNKVLATVN